MTITTKKILLFHFNINFVCLHILTDSFDEIKIPLTQRETHLLIRHPQV